VTHYRHRIVEPVLAKMLSYSPCVGVLGMRQVGKSTLLKIFSQRYHTFDEDEFLFKFSSSSRDYLENKICPLALDEIQKHPPAFDALKFSIDSNKKPGRFIISGSVRFSARKKIRESLTGRIVLLEVMPLTLSECHQKSPSIFLSLLENNFNEQLVKKLKKVAWASDSQIRHHSQAGGLPGICFRRDESIRQQMFTNHLDTLFGRDIHLIVNTKLAINKLKEILIAIAREQGLPISYSKLARLAATSVPTIQNILMAMQGLFLIRPHGKTYYIEDSGLSHFLNPSYGDFDRLTMIRCLYHEMKTQFEIQLRHQADWAPYTTRGGIDIPFLIKFKNGRRVAIVVENDKLISDKSLKSLVWCKKRFPNTQLLALTRSDSARTLTSGILSLPWTWVF
jgi:predicted AAA+ superfamily ATPase